MNERSSLDIPGAEIYVGVVAGFYQSGWHSFASTRRPGVGREQVLIRVTVTRFLESVPIHNASPALSLSLARLLAEISRHGEKLLVFYRFDAANLRLNYSPRYLGPRLCFDLFEKPRG